MQKKDLLNLYSQEKKFTDNTFLKMLTDPVVNSYSELLATSMYVQSYAHVCTHILYILGILMSILLLLLQ